MENHVTDDEAFKNTFGSRVLNFALPATPLEVESAFGGLGIYKISYVMSNPNPYLGSKVKIVPAIDGSPRFTRWQVCEHVHFHLGIRSMHGKLFIYPDLINGVNAGLTFPSSAFRNMLFEGLRIAGLREK